MAGGIGASLDIKGDAETKAKLERLGREMQTRGADALNAVMTEELDEMKNRTPYDEGALQESGRVVPAIVTAQEISVGVRFGETTPRPYAVVQHERYWYQHDDGHARWVWFVIDESKKYIIGRIARKIFGS